MPTDQGCLQTTFALRMKDGIQQLTEYIPPRRKVTSMPKQIVWRMGDNSRKSPTQRLDKHRTRGSSSRGAKTSQAIDVNRNDRQICFGDRVGGSNASYHSANNIPITIGDSVGSPSSPTVPATPLFLNADIVHANVVAAEFDSQSRVPLSMAISGHQPRGTPFSANQPTHSVSGNSLPEAGNALDLHLHSDSNQGQNMTNNKHAEVFSSAIHSAEDQLAVIVGQSYSTTSMVQHTHNPELALVLQCSHCGCYFPLDSQPTTLSPCSGQGLGNQSPPVEAPFLTGHHDPEPLCQSPAQFNGAPSHDHSHTAIPNISVVAPSGFSGDPTEASRSEFPWICRPQSHSELPPLMIPTDMLQYRQVASAFPASASTESSNELLPTPQSTMSYGSSKPYYSPYQVDGWFTVDQ